jgi:hypothetical protein
LACCWEGGRVKPAADSDSDRADYSEYTPVHVHDMIAMVNCAAGAIL